MARQHFNFSRFCPYHGASIGGVKVARGARRRRGDAVSPSYAHATEDLAVNIRHLLSLPGAIPAGFMGQESRGSMYWTDELLHAVGTCQVLVALLSARYLA